MKPFEPLNAIAVPLDDANIDTGRIIPSRFLRKARAPGYEKFLFRDARFDGEGNERPDFIMNRQPYRNAQILVADANFACGSSREAAVYVLVDAGFRCVIAPSFGETFFNNCFRNGLLPVRVSSGQAHELRRQLHGKPGARIKVDLEEQFVEAPDGSRLAFEIDTSRKLRLLRGLDDSALALEYLNDIAAFESRYFSENTWAVPSHNRGD
jgi:3-isopropylmalate/(R)-2-methylmalate dehydratase small subunit